MITPRILVTYATHHGSTGEIAEEIASTLRETGANVTVRPIKDVHNLIPYSAVIIGSAEYNGALLPEAYRFVRNHKFALSRMPVAYFVVTMTLVQQPSVGSLIEASHYLAPVSAIVSENTPVGIAMFAGSVKPDIWNLPGRLAEALNYAPYGDFRNWEKIRSWAIMVQQKLMPAA